MEQIGPTTGEFAAYRKVQKQTCEEIVAAIMEAASVSKDQAQAMIVMVGLVAMGNIRALATQRSDSPKVVDLVVDACLTGFGWAGVAAFYDLSTDYTGMLDELNDMKVKDDNDLPPTKEKG